MVAGARLPAAPAAHSTPVPDDTRRATWRIPGRGMAIAVITVTFFGDSALESFLGVYLTGRNTAGSLLAGPAISASHLASLLGRPGSARLRQRHGERRTLRTAGLLLATAGITAVVTVPYARVLIGGPLTVAPVVPIALSLAARSPSPASAPAENLIRPGQSASRYSWRMPPSRSRFRMSRRVICSGSVIGAGSGWSGRALAMPWWGRWVL
jgi:hypothetical protein